MRNILQVVGQGKAEYPQTMQAISIVLDCFLEFVPKTLLLKTPHSSDTGVWGIEVQMIWKRSPWALALIVLEGALQAVKGEKQCIVLSSCTVYEPQQWLVVQDTLKGIIVPLKFWQ